MGSLTGSRVLVIGGTSGIGLATAEAALLAGATVTIASNRSDSLAAASVTLKSPALTTRIVDTFDDASIEALFSGTDTYQHVVLTAAWSKVGSVHGLSLDDAYKGMESKFWGSYKVARAARFAKHGSLTLISGNTGSRPDRNAVLQGAINAAIESLGRGLALDLAPTRVNVISPGLVDTPLYATVDPVKRKAMFEHALETIPVRKVGQAEDIAAAILFAIMNPYMSGSTIVVDGAASIA